MQTKFELTAANLDRANATFDQMLTKFAGRVSALVKRDGRASAECPGIAKSLADPAVRRSWALLIGADAIDAETLPRIIGNHDAKNTPAANYVQTKSLVKIMRTINALALTDLSYLDAYTAQPVYAALNHGGSLTRQGAIVTLSRQADAGKLGKSERDSITSRATYTMGTGGSQASQVADVMRVLGLADVDKGARNVTMHFIDRRVDNLRALFALPAR